jgi:hypothetical protein
MKEFIYKEQRYLTQLSPAVLISKKSSVFNQCCGSGMFIPDPNFSIPDHRSRVKRFRIPNPGFGSASKNFSILTQKTVSKLSENRFGMFIPDPGSGS